MSRLFGAPAVASSGDGRLEVFVFDIEGTLWHIWQTQWSNGWSGWASRGEGGQWPAVVAPSGDGRLELFVKGSGLRHASQTAWSNGWSQFSTHGSPPPISSSLGFFAPGIAPYADGRLTVFVANGALWRLEQTAWSDGWSEWLPLGSPSAAFVIGPVTAARSGDGRIEVFVVDTHGNMWNIRQGGVNGPWSEWNPFGSAGNGLDDRPGLALNADGRLELFARGNDGALWHRRQTRVSVEGDWSNWVSEGAGGGGFADHPVVGRSPDGCLQLFLTGHDGSIWRKAQTSANNGWSPWISEGSAGGGFAVAPALGRSGDGRLELFVVGADGSLWHKWQTAANNGWSAWTSHGQPSVAPPTTIVPDVFGLRAGLARQTILSAHLVPAFTGPDSPNPWVGSQSPIAGKTVQQGSIVTMRRRIGPIP